MPHYIKENGLVLFFEILFFPSGVYLEGQALKAG